MCGLAAKSTRADVMLGVLTKGSVGMSLLYLACERLVAIVASVINPRRACAARVTVLGS